MPITTAIAGSDSSAEAPRPAWKPMAVLLAAAAALFTANAFDLSLPALDDCFYARKAVEMARDGGVFTVTWNGQPTFQNPPLQIFLIARSVALLGENDFAARLPSILMALGILAGTYLVGVRTVGREAGLAGVALLLLSPDFANNARRTMMEVPLTFWVVAALLVFLEALGRPRLALVLALPFGAAILTKSVLGLIVIPILFAAAAAAPALRKPLTGPWSWAGLAAGVALGASWSVHQYGLHGDRSLGEHFLSEIASRSAAGFDPLGAVLAYPEILLTRFEPVVIPGLIGAWCLWRTRPERGPAALLPVWVLVPVALYSLSAVRTARYVFPVFPALALCAGHWLCLAAPRLAGATTRFVAPGVAVLAAAAFWVRPDLLARSATAAFKADTALEARMPEGGGVPYLGTRYWELANPMLYYAERYLRPPSETPEEAVAATRRTAARILVVDDAARGPVEALARLEDVVRGPGWSAVYIGP